MTSPQREQQIADRSDSPGRSDYVSQARRKRIRTDRNIYWVVQLMGVPRLVTSLKVDDINPIPYSYGFPKSIR
jgi:hypothetical protein